MMSIFVYLNEWKKKKEMEKNAIATEITTAKAKLRRKLKRNSQVTKSHVFKIRVFDYINLHESIK